MKPQRLRKHYLDTSRGLVHVQEAGDPAAPLLVIITPTSFSSPLLGGLLLDLAGRGWRALASDLMGYGRSDKRQGHWRVEDFADNQIEAIAQLGVPPVGLVCGHFACWTGIEIAARRAWPGLRGLVLDGCPRYTPEQRAQAQADGPPPPQPWTEDGLHARAYWDKVWRILHKLTPERPLASVPSQRFREAVMCLLEASVYEPNTAMAAAHFELERRLPEVTLPTLVMCSDTDWNLPHHDALCALLPQAHSLRLPGVNPLHDPDRERGAEYAAPLHAFFSAC